MDTADDDWLFAVEVIERAAELKEASWSGPQTQTQP